MTNESLILAILAAFVATSVPAAPQEAVQLVTKKQSIPKNFKTYSLFLVCNPQWLDPAKNTGLLQLYRQFQNFGRAIGDDQLRVWFWKSNSYEHDDARLPAT